MVDNAFVVENTKFGVRLDLIPQDIFDIISNDGGNSWMSRYYVPHAGE